MELTTVTNVSLDGVTQGTDAYRSGPRQRQRAARARRRVRRFGWGPPLLDDEASTFISERFQRAEAFLLGRRTYGIFAGSWGAGTDPTNPVGEALNARPKYVASTTLRDPQWANTTVPSGDVTTSVTPAESSRSSEIYRESVPATTRPPERHTP